VAKYGLIFNIKNNFIFKQQADKTQQTKMIGLPLEDDLMVLTSNGIFS